MNIPAHVARAQGAHGSKGAAHGVKGAVHGSKGGRPRLALTDDERAQRRRDQQLAYRRRKGIMPKQVLTWEERQEGHRKRLAEYWDKEYLRVWRKLPGKPLTPGEFAARQNAFRAWVRNCRARNSPLAWAVGFVRSHLREKRQRQHAESLRRTVDRKARVPRIRKEPTYQVLIPCLEAPPPSVGRNHPCPCGSGRKFKKCCGP